MIDIEKQIYTPIAKAAREKFPGLTVRGVYVKSPPKLPLLTIVEQDNYTVKARMDSSDTERFATVLYEVNIYSNNSDEKKSNCREIMRFVDNLFYRMNFTRLSMTPVPNMNDATIYRLNVRYQAATDGEKMYRI
nr:MAG TPA: hypothetical protein [Caudoviricetes sp.]